jgi:hypothetical protein
MTLTFCCDAFHTSILLFLGEEGTPLKGKVVVVVVVLWKHPESGIWYATA